MQREERPEIIAMFAITREKHRCDQREVLGTFRPKRNKAGPIYARITLGVARV